jgi:predicted membrane channel-forming protein YqfA (hemolysin III family)
MQLLRLDLIGIGLMIFGLVMSFAYLAMHNYDALKHASVALIGALLVSNLVVQMTPCYGRENFHGKRVLMFVGMIVFGLGLIIYCRT